MGAYPEALQLLERALDHSGVDHIHCAAGKHSGRIPS